MKWAIVFYAFITVPNGEAVEHLSWGLTFNHHEQFIKFFEENEQKIIDGLNVFVNRHYKQPVTMKEVGCTHATADFTQPEQERDPITSLHMPLWSGTNV